MGDGNGSGGKAESWGERLTPEMVDFRLLVLDFVHDYIGRWRSSPSYGEIANALQSNKTRVRKAVKSLVADGKLHRTPGPRGLSLPSMRDQALQLLRLEGLLAEGGTLMTAVTHRPLLPPPALDYPRDGTSLSQDGDPDEPQGTEESGQTRTA